MHVLGVGDESRAPFGVEGQAAVDRAGADADRGSQPVSRHLDAAVEHLLYCSGGALNPCLAFVGTEELRSLDDRDTGSSK